VRVLEYRSFTVEYVAAIICTMLGLLQRIGKEALEVPGTHSARTARRKLVRNSDVERIVVHGIVILVIVRRKGQCTVLEHSSTRTVQYTFCVNKINVLLVCSRVSRNISVTGSLIRFSNRSSSTPNGDLQRIQ
jgi:hypothetical protein